MINGTGGESKTVVKFGFLVEVQNPFILGSVALAVDAVNGDGNVLPGVRLDYMFERIHSKKTSGCC